MKNAFLITLFLVITYSSFSQKSFTGTIVYSLHSSDSMDLKSDTEITITFGKSVIIMQLNGDGSTDARIKKNELMIRLDSGKVFSLDYHDSSYRLISRLYPSIEPEKLRDETIAGYTTTQHDYIGTSSADWLSHKIEYGNVTLHVADSLCFLGSDKYAPSEYLILVNNNKIVLSIDITAVKNNWIYRRNDTAKLQVENLRLQAKQITWKNFNDSDFEIPGSGSI